MYPRSMADSDCVVIQGSNMAECHPVAFRWPMQAKAKGAKLIHVDPRFTRISAMADIHAPIRAGSDVAFVSLIGTYFLRGRGFNIAQTGLLASLPLWGGALGGIAGGWLNDRAIAWTGSRRWSRPVSTLSSGRLPFRSRSNAGSASTTRIRKLRWMRWRAASSLRARMR